MNQEQERGTSWCVGVGVVGVGTLATACSGSEPRVPGAPSVFTTTTDDPRRFILAAASVDARPQVSGGRTEVTRPAACVNRVSRRIRAAVEKGHVTLQEARKLRRAFRLFCRAVESGELSRTEARRMYVDPVLEEVFPERPKPRPRRRIPGSR